VRACLAVTVAVFAAAFAGAAQAEPVTTADQAKTLAQAINLTNADMLGYEVAPGDNSNTVGDPALVRCAHAVPASRQLADVSSDGFSAVGARGIDYVGSDVMVWSSTDDAAADSAAFFSARGRACFKNALLKVVRKDQTAKIKVVGVTASKLASGLANVRGMRIKIVLRSGKARVAEFVDIFDYTRGQAEVVLTALSAPRPFAAGKAHRLLGLLTQRAVEQIPDASLTPGAPQGGLSG
jgi:hypothetical protein